MAKFTNWSNTHSCDPECIFSPRSEQEIIEIVHQASTDGKHVRVVGAGHSPSDIACTDEWMLKMDEYNKVLHIDTDACTVKVQSGIRLFQLHAHLAKHHLAMSNLGSISEQSLAGALSTGTHGTGAQFGILATQVLEMTLILADGSIRDLSRHNESKDTFLAALCSLGALGIISTVTLQVEPMYNLASEQFLISFQQLCDNWTVLINSAQLVRFWWYPYTDKVLVWRAKRTLRPVTSARPSWWQEKFVGRYLLEYLLYLSSYLPSTLPTLNNFYASREGDQVNPDCFKVEPFDDTKPHCRVGSNVVILNFDCLFEQHVTEWCAPEDDALKALKELKKSVGKDASKKIHAHFPVEVRFVNGDDIWLSPAHGVGKLFCYIGIIIYRPYGRDVVLRQEYWRVYENIMKSVGGKPHWAKAFSLSYLDLKKLYPMLERFSALRQQLDPKGMFMNDYLRRHLTESVLKAKL